MTLHHIDVLAVGNAIVDIFGQCDDNFLVANKIEKGVMTLVDPAASEQLYAALNTLAKPQLISGGSAANTAVGVVNLVEQLTLLAVSMMMILELLFAVTLLLPVLVLITRLPAVDRQPHRQLFW